MKTIKIILISLWMLLAPALDAKPLLRPAVMAPLIVEDWQQFEHQLQSAKAIGVVAVTTDVWWGKVELQDQQFDWSYYDRISETIARNGLKWIPILSFHQCGGNVGDVCDIPIPEWLWTQLGGDQSQRLKYKSEKGNFSNEVLSLWADDLAESQYMEMMQAFKNHMAEKSVLIEEINISAGPAGELRYPSYNQHDGFQYPGRGFLQAYSQLALADFRRYVMNKYGSLEQVNRAWGTALTDTSQISPPTNGEFFFSHGDYRIPYGRDFFDWYNGALVKHGEFMLTMAGRVFNGEFSHIPLGLKIPGIHWLVGAPEHPRIAEMTAGLIITSSNYFSPDSAHGYGPILDMVAAQNAPERDVILHFTCLEMGNPNTADAYSRAMDLVFWVAQGAEARGLAIMGENALSGNLYSHDGWNNIDNAMYWASYTGLTVLRVGDVTTGNDLGHRRYKQLIETYRP